jgi:rhodanese-related sulfurtransferase
VYEQGDDVQILDVRELYEWNAGRIERALHLPLNEVMAGREDGRLDASKPVYVVCRMGNRSELASLMLRARGYDAHNMEGGMQAWQSEGLPFTAVDGGPGQVA